jgi:hypothetical protein
MDVKFGEVWKIGNHTIRCADLEQKMFPFPGALTPDVIYSDPPVGAGECELLAPSDGRPSGHRL